MSVEAFLAALQDTAGRSLRKYFVNSDALAQGHRGGGVVDKGESRGSPLVSSAPGVGPSGLSFHDVRFTGFEDELTRLLWDAATIARVTKGRSASLGEFVAAICLNAELVSRLQTKGVRPIGFINRPAARSGSTET